MIQTLTSGIYSQSPPPFTPTQNTPAPAGFFTQTIQRFKGFILPATTTMADQTQQGSNPVTPGPSSKILKNLTNHGKHGDISGSLTPIKPYPVGPSQYTESHEANVTLLDSLGARLCSAEDEQNGIGGTALKRKADEMSKDWSSLVVERAVKRFRVTIDPQMKEVKDEVGAVKDEVGTVKALVHLLPSPETLSEDYDEVVRSIHILNANSISANGNFQNHLTAITQLQARCESQDKQIKRLTNIVKTFTDKFCNEDGSPNSDWILALMSSSLDEQQGKKGDESTEENSDSDE